MTSDQLAAKLMDLSKETLETNVHASLLLASLALSVKTGTEAVMEQVLRDYTTAQERAMRATLRGRG